MIPDECLAVYRYAVTSGRIFRFFPRLCKIKNNLTSIQILLRDDYAWANPVIFS